MTIKVRVFDRYDNSIDRMESIDVVYDASPFRQYWFTVALNLFIRCGPASMGA